MNVNELYESLKAKDKKKFKDGYTLYELVAESGMSRTWVRERLRLLLAKGLLEIGRKSEMDLNGNTVEVPAYKFLPVKEEK